MSLLTKYRPTKFSEVIGQDAVVGSLRTALEKEAGRVFLFTGPSGVGKTTLSRIVASQVGCNNPINLLEIDAATHTGVDDMRSVCEGVYYMPLSGDKTRAVILDEAHMLSRNAWNSLLKILEQPPKHVYWFLCTTEPGKVPKTVMTRCLRYELKLVPRQDLADLLYDVLDAEKLKLGEEEGGIIDLCVKEAEGSPRQALSNLAVCLSATTRKEAAELLLTAEGAPEAIEFVRALYDGQNWERLRDLIAGMGNVNAESVRQVVRAWGTKMMLNAKTERQWSWALEVLNCFAEPCYGSDGITPILRACGRLLR